MEIGVWKKFFWIRKQQTHWVSILFGEKSFVLSFKQIVLLFSDVYVTNKISELATTLLVNVLEPSPLDLQIINFVDPVDQPSCLPEEITIPEKSQFFSVFKGANFSLEASLAVGENVTFTFDDGSPETREVKASNICTDGCSTIQVC